MSISLSSGEKSLKVYAVLMPVLIAVFAGLRLLNLFTAIENVTWPEELGVGTITREILSGLARPVWNYQLSGYSGESLVLAFAAVPLFKLLGPNLIALKLVSWAFLAATVSTMAIFLKRHFGPAAAVWALILWILSPPVFTAQFLFVLIGHSESLLVTAGTLFLFYEYLFGSEEKDIFLYAAGLLAGFGFWFYPATGIAFAACLVLWSFVKPASFISLKLAAAAICFTAGLTPWFLSNGAHSFQGLQFITAVFQGFFTIDVSLILKRAVRLVISLPHSFSFLPQTNPLQKEAGHLYCFLFISVSAPFFYHQIKNNFDAKNFKSLLFFFYPLLFLMVYAASSFQVPHDSQEGNAFRYLTPLFFLGVIPAALAISRGFVKKAILAPFLFLSVCAQAPILFQEPFALGLNARGYSYYEAGANDFDFVRESRGYADLARRASMYPAPESQNFLWGSVSVHGPLWIEEEGGPSAHLFQKMPEPRLPWAVEFAGSFSGSYYAGDLKKIMERFSGIPEGEKQRFFKGVFSVNSPVLQNVLKTPALLEYVYPDVRHWFFYGAAGLYAQCRETSCPDMKSYQAFADSLAGDEKKWFFRGMGDCVPAYHSMTVRQDFRARIQKMHSEIPRDFIREFYWGIGWQTRTYFLEDRARSLNWLLSNIPIEFQGSAAEGFAAAEEFYFAAR